jgi:hypothetical protein
LYFIKLQKGIIMADILASAIVDILKPATPKDQGLFKVTVWGQPPYDYTEIYEIQATSDTIAAQQGISRFVADATALGPKGT